MEDILEGAQDFSCAKRGHESSLGPGKLTFKKYNIVFQFRSKALFIFNTAKWNCWLHSICSVLLDMAFLRGLEILSVVFEGTYIFR